MLRDARSTLLSKMKKHSVCAEIGVWKGRFSKNILDAMKPKMLHLIDPYKYQPEFGPRLYGGKVAKSQEDMDEIFEATKKRFARFRNVTFHRDFSNKTSTQFEDAYFDWVYIDGNHAFEYVLEDLELYFPKVKSGGFLTGDDFSWSPSEKPGTRPVTRLSLIHI